VRAKALKFDQNEDVGFNEGLAEVEEFLEKTKVREAFDWGDIQLTFSISLMTLWFFTLKRIGL
jgi:hypothetical protein